LRGWAQGCGDAPSAAAALHSPLPVFTPRPHPPDLLLLQLSPSHDPPPRLCSWIIAAAGLTLSLNSLGVNVLPLLTLGGASTIVVGLASQQLLANALNGVSIVGGRGGRGRGRGAGGGGGGAWAAAR
jgi:hypothetical protein